MVARGSKAVAATVALALVAAGCGFQSGSIDAGPRWDPRIAPLAEFAAAHRGLQFKHPVPTHFLSKATYDREFNATAPPNELYGDLPTDRALGLVEPGAEKAIVKVASSSQTIALYRHQP